MTRRVGDKLLACFVLLAGIGGFAARTDAAEASSLARPDAAVERLRLPDVKLWTEAGAEIPVALLAGTKGTALVFLSTECPISNGYVPTLNALAKEFSPRGIQFVLANPNAGQSLADLAAHRAEFALEPAVYQDRDGALANAVGATHCPEACVFDGQGRMAYRGRIDDRYAARGQGARDARQHDLRDALEAVLSGAPVTVRRTTSVGCPISLAARKADQAKTGASPAPAPNGPTYSREVARLLAKHCQECHRPDGVGPFALETFDDAVSWAEDLVALTADGRMPPWKPAAPAAQVGEFHNQRGLSADEKKTLADWVGAGCPEGDPSDLPAPIVFPTGWRKGTPDLVLEMEGEYELGPDGADVYRNFVFPTSFDRDQYLVGYEVLPGNRKVVHHVLLFVDTSDQGEKLDRADPAPGYGSGSDVGLPGFVPNSMLGGWAPGNSPENLPQGLARVLPRGARLIMQVHYHKTGKAERDRTKVGLYLSKEPPRRAVGVMPLEPLSARIGLFLIPKNRADHVGRCSATLGHGITVVSITPHMHLLGRSMKVTATLPDGSKRTMIDVPDWDFKWQETYYYRQPLELPAGTRMDLEAHFDNTANNPNNPHRPPRLVRYGEQTTEEMCICFVEAAWHGDVSSPDELKPPGLEVLFGYQVDKLLKFVRR